LETFQLRQRQYPGKTFPSPGHDVPFSGSREREKRLLITLLFMLDVVRPAANEQCVLIGPDSNWHRVILDESQCKSNTRILI
jgi:hypothetical protein